MSCYEWERGSIIIPASQWAGFKKSIRDAVNSQTEKDFVLVTRVFEETLNAGKGKRKFDFATACQLILNSRAYEKLSHGVIYRLFPKKSDTGVKPVRPQKKDFHKLTNKTVEIDNDDCTVTFNDKTHTVSWSVRENNHAVEDAHESVLGQAFFSALRKIKWNRGSGGELVGNNEYNRDDCSSGGGANFTTSQYGPIGQKRQLGRRAW